MAGSPIFRFFRFLRSICAPMTSIILFSLLLTWIFILYQPTRGPGDIQRLGWQAWDVVSISGMETDDEAVFPGEEEPEDHQAEVNWWNVTTPDKQTETTSTSLPLDVWQPLLPHDTGLTQIEVVSCIFPPWTSVDFCAPKSSAEEDAIKGKWVRVQTDLNQMSGMWSLYIYYRRSRRLDVDLIKEIQLLPADQQPDTPGNWHKVSKSIRDGVMRVPPLFLWYDLGPPLKDLTDEEKTSLITEIDILYGDDRPWYGFQRIEPPTTPGQEGRLDDVWVTYRRGVKKPPQAPPLHFDHDGKFKVLQIADLHYSVSPGSCRDVDFSPCTHSDNLTNSLIAHVLDAEKPDMVVFTGDQLNGQGTSYQPKSVIAKFATMVTDRNIPWAAVFGNHDSESGATREDQIKMLQALPYSLVSPGPSDVHGVGNYVLKVKSADPSKTHLLTLYFLDSGAYAAGYFDFFGFFTPTEYDWIHSDQIDWFLKQSASIDAIERPFTPDGGKDFSGIWKRQGIEQLTPGMKKLAKPNAMMFFHIPLPENKKMAADVDPDTSITLDFGISGLEDDGAAKKSDGFFEKGILQASESDHSASGNIREVKVIGNGHSHITENCKRIKGVWMCFGGGGSYSGYGKAGFDRRFRIYDISDYGETIRTYKRTEKDEIVDEMVLVGKGAPAPYEGLRR